MILIDTHTHLFLEQFDDDRNKVVEDSIKNGVKKLFIPNIDSSTTEKVVKMGKDYPGICYPIIGLHPTSVKGNYREELEHVEQWLSKEKFYGIGETGIDLYWDKTFKKEQEEAFRYQINLAKRLGLPLIIHSRESFDEIFSVVDELNDEKLKGVFHSFTGTIEQAKKILSYKGFKIGIGGIVTFKNSGLANVVAKIDVGHLVLETDSPYLAPTPMRGRRNESSYLKLIAQKLADVYCVDIETVANITSQNAKKLFAIA
ncbi:MAG: hydrolase TatD [Bacteroidetes bacterium 4572_117]|nr:MAG: hydrolase TatD [Bacteroidetes bacterium 4572_117]